MKKLHAYVTIEIRNKYGQLVSFEKREANSYVKGLIDCIYCGMASTTLAGVIDTGNVSRTLYLGSGSMSGYWSASAPSTNSAFGIVVGSGTSAVTIADYALGTMIAHGTGAGQLVYNASVISSPTTAGSTRSFTILRSFTNSTANAITINEVALYMYFEDSGGVARPICIDRTLSTKIISAGFTATVVYTIGVTV